MIIEIKKSKFLEGTEQARHDFAVIYGKEFKLKPPVFYHLETHHHYCNIIGGIAYPTIIEPGIIIILGVRQNPIRYEIFEIFEEVNIFKLITQLVRARKKYGFGKDSRILPNWYGEQDRFQTLIIRASEELEKKYGHTYGLYIKDYVDIKLKNALALYVRQIYSCLESGKLIKESLGDQLKQHLQAFQREDAEKGKIANYPAVGLLGGIIHSLEIERPWLEDVAQGESFNIAI